MRGFDLAVPRLRRIAARNLALRFRKPTPRQITDGVFTSLAQDAGGVLPISRLAIAAISEIGFAMKASNTSKKPSAAVKACLFATAHLGAWELSAFAHALMARPMHVVIRPLDNPLIDRLVSRRQNRFREYLIPKKDAARGILRALKNNEAVGILVDQNVAADEGVFVDFFGHEGVRGQRFRQTRRIAAGRLSFRVSRYGRKTEKKYILRFYPLLEFTGDVEADTQMLHSCLENVIREYPDQWLWIHRRWKTRPAGDAAALLN